MHQQSDGGANRRDVLRSIGAGAVGAAGLATTNGAAIAQEDTDYYENPVGPVGFGDVTIIREEDTGTYYAYGTETPLDIVPIAESEDMVTWEYIAPALEEYPDWRDDPDAGVWAPDINYWNGQYHLYYSYSTWGSQDNPGIGLATADSPDGPFEDQGPVFRNEDLGMTNCIDGEFVVVDGQPWMVWGSWYGIHAVQLNEAGDDYIEDTAFQLAGNMREGGMIVQENDYYYLFYSTGHCCDGYDSTYEVEVGRAEEFTGPYVNQEGTDLRDLNDHRDGVAILSGTDRFTGPGHNSAYQDPDGNWWMYYHVEATTEDETRYMMVDRIEWDDDDWPVVACNGHPSARSPTPMSGEFSCDSEVFESSVAEQTPTPTPTATPTPAETAEPTEADDETTTDVDDPATTTNGDGLSILAGVTALGATAAGAMTAHRDQDETDAE